MLGSDGGFTACVKTTTGASNPGAYRANMKGFSSALFKSRQMGSFSNFFKSSIAVSKIVMSSLNLPTETGFDGFHCHSLTDFGGCR